MSINLLSHIVYAHACLSEVFGPGHHDQSGRLLTGESSLNLIAQNCRHRIQANAAAAGTSTVVTELLADPSPASVGSSSVPPGVAEPSDTVRTLVGNPGLSPSAPVESGASAASASASSSSGAASPPPDGPPLPADASSAPTAPQANK